MLHDVHAHLTHDDLIADIEGLVARAEDAGLGSIIVNGLHPKDNQHVLELSERFPILKPAFGFYPVDTVYQDMHADGIKLPWENTAEQPYLVSADDGVAWVREHARHAFAIGEIGLDGHWVPEPYWLRQEQVFVQLLNVAKDVNKTAIIHTRKREARTLELLQQEGMRKVNWHCFSGKLKIALAGAEMGHCFSIPCNARRSETFTQMIKKLPRTAILLETDCPYLGKDAGGKSEPSHVHHTAEYIAELWQVPLPAVLEQLQQNFNRMFVQS